MIAQAPGAPASLIPRKTFANIFVHQFYPPRPERRPRTVARDLSVPKTISISLIAIVQPIASQSSFGKTGKRPLQRNLCGAVLDLVRFIECKKTSHGDGVYSRMAPHPDWNRPMTFARNALPRLHLGCRQHDVGKLAESLLLLLDHLASKHQPSKIGIRRAKKLIVGIQKALKVCLL
jgi:hypothetical protein